MLAPRPSWVVTLPAAEPLAALAHGPAGLVASARGGSAWGLAPAGGARWHVHAPAGGWVVALPDGERALRFGPTGSIEMLALPSGRRLFETCLESTISDVERAIASPCGRRVFVQVGFLQEEAHLLYGDYEERVDGGLMWDLDRRATLWAEQEQRFPAVPPRFSPDGMRLLLPPGMHRGMAWVEAKSGRARQPLACVRWLGGMLLSARGDMAVHRAPGELALARSATDTERLPEPALVFGAGVPLALTPDDAAVVAWDGATLEAYEVQLGQRLGVPAVLPEGFTPSCAAFGPDFYVGSDDGRVAAYPWDGAAPGRATLAPAIAHKPSAATGLEPTL